MPSTQTDRLYGQNSAVAIKAPCVAVSSANIALSGLGAFTTPGGGSYTPNEDDRILVIGQADQTANGIYSASSTAWERTGDFDGTYDVVQGTLIIALLGNNQTAFYELTTADPIIGTSQLQIAPFWTSSLLWNQTPTEAAAGLVPANTSYQPTPVYDMQRYGIQPNGVDNTAIVQAVYNMAKVSGGTLVFPPDGDYAFYLDVSGAANKPVTIDGQGSTFRCFSSTPTQPCVVYANNSGVATATSFTTALALGATSAILSAAWPNYTGVVNVTFSDGEIRACNVTNGSTAINWTGGLAAACTANAQAQTAGNMTGCNVIFRNCNFFAREYGSATTGDVAYCIFFNGAAAKFYDCLFNYGTVAAFGALYGQYNEFWSCEFNLASATNSSAGCLLDSHGAASSSNEVNFNRCKFFDNSNGLWLKGAFTTRIRDCTLQGQSGTLANGCAALKIDADATGSETVNTIVEGCWFEINQGYHIYEVLGIRTRLHDNNTFTSGGQNEIYFTHCNDVVVTGHNDYPQTGTFSINHPAGNADTTRLTWHGNNITPTINVTHAGPTYFDISVVGSAVVTLVGTSDGPFTATCFYSVNGDAVTLELGADLLGTANVAHLSITGLPAWLAPVEDQLLLARVENNGTTTLGMLSIAGTSYTLDSDLAGSAFVNAAAAGVRAQTFPAYRLGT